jgi:hypothetical protein
MWGRHFTCPFFNIPSYSKCKPTNIGCPTYVHYKAQAFWNQGPNTSPTPSSFFLSTLYVPRSYSVTITVSFCGCCVGVLWGSPPLLSVGEAGTLPGYKSVRGKLLLLTWPKIENIPRNGAALAYRWGGRLGNGLHLYMGLGEVCQGMSCTCLQVRG